MKKKIPNYLKRDPKPDAVCKELFRNKYIFTSLMNGLFFQGENYFQSKNIHEADSDESTSIKGITINRNRDLLKKIMVGQNKVYIGLEIQQTVDKTMIFRDIVYGGLKYLIKENNKEERIGAITVTLFTGKGKWNEEVELKKYLNHIPSELDGLVNNWKILVFDIKDLNPMFFKNPRLRLFIDGVQAAYRKDYDYFASLPIDGFVYFAIAVVTGSKQLVDKVLEYERRMIPMCDMLDELLEEREIKGEVEGKVETLIKQLTKKLNQLSQTTISLIKRCTLDQLNLLLEHIFDIESEDDVLKLCK